MPRGRPRSVVVGWVGDIHRCLRSCQWPMQAGGINAKPQFSSFFLLLPFFPPLGRAPLLPPRTGGRGGHGRTRHKPHRSLASPAAVVSVCPACARSLSLSLFLLSLFLGTHPPMHGRRAGGRAWKRRVPGLVMWCRRQAMNGRERKNMSWTTIPPPMWAFLVPVGGPESRLLEIGSRAAGANDEIRGCCMTTACTGNESGDGG